MSRTRKITPLNRQKKKPIRLNTIQKILLVLLLIIVMMTTLPLMVVLSVGLLPTLTLLIIDPKNINKLITVGCFNLTGVFVYLFNVLQNYSVDNALFIFSDIFNMILMLGSAAIGLIIYYELPQLFVYIARATNQHHVTNIDNHLEKLKELWGEDVITK